MSLRIRERYEATLQVQRRDLLKAEAQRFGAFKGDGTGESHKEFLQQFEKVRETINDEEAATAFAAQLKETIRKENKRSMDTLGEIKPHLVLDLL